MQETNKYNTSCRVHSQEVIINHVAHSITWSKQDCPFCKITYLQDALQQCVEWANAYPVDIFPQPTPEQVDAVCKKLGFRIDSISAMVLRNYTGRIGEIASEALSR